MAVLSDEEMARLIDFENNDRVELEPVSRLELNSRRRRAVCHTCPDRRGSQIAAACVITLVVAAVGAQLRWWGKERRTRALLVMGGSTLASLLAAADAGRRGYSHVGAVALGATAGIFAIAPAIVVMWAFAAMVKDWADLEERASGMGGRIASRPL
jgi:hypothetical protein